MIKKYTSYYVLSFIVEALLGVVALWAAELVRNLVFLRFFIPAGAPFAPLALPLWLLPAAAGGLPFFLYLNHAHSFPSRVPLREMAWPTAKAVIQLVIIIVAVSFALNSQDTSRLALVFFGFFAYGLALLKQSFFEFLLARSRPHWEILLVGNSTAALAFLDTLQEKWPCGISIFGLLTDDPDLQPGERIGGVKVLGRIDVWEKILRYNQIIDEVVIFTPPMRSPG
ncbi:MAG TPA: hypothetical protein PK636_05795, partial [bacterium]|nr:hypothetical protein [bacterium]